MIVLNRSFRRSSNIKMKAIEILKQRREELIIKAKTDSTLTNQIAELTEAIKNLEFCEKHKLSYKDQVIEIEPLDNFGCTRLVKYTDDDEIIDIDSYEDLIGLELIIRRAKT